MNIFCDFGKTFISKIKSLFEEITSKSYNCKCIFFVSEIVLSVALLYFITTKLLFNFFINTDLYFHLYSYMPKSVSGILKSLFFSPDHYVFLLPLYENLSIKYLSQFLNIHPQVCVEKYTSVLLFISFVLWLFVIAQNFLKYIKKEIFIPFASVLILPFVLYLLDNSRFFWVFYSIVWFVGYIVISFFPILLINFCEYFYVRNKALPKKIFLVTVLLIILTAFSHEYYRFLMLGTAFLMIVFDNIFIKRKINYTKIYLLYFLCVLLYILPMLISNLLNGEYSTRLAHLTVSEFFAYLLPYLSLYIDSVIINNLYIIFPLIILYSLAVLPDINSGKISEQKRFAVFVISVLITNFMFYLLLVFHSESHYCGNILTEQNGLIFVCKLTLFNLILSCSGFILYSCKNNIRRILMAIFIVLPILFSFLNYKNFLVETDSFRQNADYLKKNMYILEKVYCLSKSNNYEYVYLYNKNNFNYFYIEYYLYNLYNQKSISKPEKIKTKFLCDTNNPEVCVKNIKDVAKREFDYQFSQHELNNTDFAELYQYSEKNTKTQKDVNLKN